VSIRFRFRPVADACGAPVLRDQGPIGRPGTARPMQAPSGTASYLSVTCGPDVAHANIHEYLRLCFVASGPRNWAGATIMFKSTNCICM